MKALWGTHTIQSVIETGTFFCPRCYMERPYIHSRMTNYFVVLFKPLFKRRVIAEFVKCRKCTQFYKLGILSHKVLSPAVDLLTAVHQEFDSGMTSNAVKNRLVRSGLSERVAQKIVASWINDTS